MVGVASASTLAMTGSSTASGSRPRTRETRSRTSAAASSGFLLELEAHRDLALLGARDRGDDVHAVDAGDRVLQRLGDLRLDDLGRGADQPVVTVTTGSSMRGYSRTDRRSKDTSADQHDQQRHHGREAPGGGSRFRRAHGAGSVRATARAAPARRGRAAGAARPRRRRRAAPARSVDHAHRQRVAAQQPRLAGRDHQVAGGQAFAASRPCPAGAGRCAPRCAAPPCPRHHRPP